MAVFKLIMGKVDESPSFESHLRQGLINVEGFNQSDDFHDERHVGEEYFTDQKINDCHEAPRQVIHTCWKSMPC